MVRYVCRAIWNASELTGVGLGRFAPYVLGGMIDALPEATR